MILVTGANGLIGSFICKKLASSNIRFRALVRSKSDLHLLNDLNGVGELYESDILDLITLEEAFEGITKVIHCAAIISFIPRNKKKMYKVNIEGTKNIVDLSLKYNIQKFIYLSSVAAIGKNKIDKIVDENNTWPGTIAPTNYGKSKYLAELEVWRGNMEGLPVITVIPSVVLGPGNWKNGSTQLFRYVWEQNKFYKSGFLNYVDVRDLSECVIQLINSSLEGERFIVSAGMISYKEFFEKIARQMNRKPPSIRARPIHLYLALGIDKLLSLFPGKEQRLSRETISQSNNEITYSSLKIQKSISQSFTDIDDTIQWACQILKKNYG